MNSDNNTSPILTAPVPLATVMEDGTTGEINKTASINQHHQKPSAENIAVRSEPGCEYNSGLGGGNVKRKRTKKQAKKKKKKYRHRLLLPYDSDSAWSGDEQQDEENGLEKKDGNPVRSLNSRRCVQTPVQFSHYETASDTSIWEEYELFGSDDDNKEYNQSETDDDVEKSGNDDKWQKKFPLAQFGKTKLTGYTPRQNDWDQRIRDLLKFRDEFGHTRVPQRYKANRSLGRWIKKLRERYRNHQLGKNPTLEEEQIAQLREIGFEFKIRDCYDGVNSFEGQLMELDEYKKVNGHCNVPHVYKENLPLGNWCHHQRNMYRLRQEGKQVKLTEEQISALEDIGFSWRTTRSDLFWEKRYTELRCFKAEFGHCQVPKHFPSSPRLRGWVNKQREQYNANSEGKKTLTNDDRIRMLEGLGFEWTAHEEPQENRSSSIVLDKDDEDIAELPSKNLKKPKLIDYLWSTNYQKLREFKGEFGHFQVTKEYDSKLFYWASNQKCAYSAKLKGKKTCITDDRIAKLNAIDFQWARSQTRDSSTELPNRKNTMSKDEAWHAQYDKLCEFKEKFGHFQISKDYDEKLSHWSTNQKSAYSAKLKGKKTCITDDRIANLNAIGFQWARSQTRDDCFAEPPNKKNSISKDEAWQAQYDKLCEFKEKFGHFQISCDYDAKLSYWVTNQKSGYSAKLKGKQTFLTDDRIAKLNAINIQWARPRTKDLATETMESPNKSSKNVIAFEDIWQEQYNKLSEFKKKSGHLQVSSDDDMKLYYWVRNQKSAYRAKMEGKKTCMTDDRMEHLKALDFQWARSRSHTSWQTQYEKLKEYKHEFGNCLVPNQFSPDPEFCRWVNAQRWKFRAKMSGEKAPLMKDEKFEKLKAIDFEEKKGTEYSKRSTTSWEEHYKKLCQFKSDFGHCIIPFKNFSDDPAFKNWVNNQRYAYRMKMAGKKVSMPDERKKKLDLLNFMDGVKGAPEGALDTNRLEKYPPTLAVDLQRESNNSEMHDSNVGVDEHVGIITESLKNKERVRVPWEEQFEKLRLFFLKMGHCRVTSSSTTDLALYNWVKNQKSFYRMKVTGKKSCMTDERKEKLDEINLMEWAKRGQAEKSDLDFNKVETHPSNSTVDVQKDSNNSKVPDSNPGADEHSGVVTESLNYKKRICATWNDQFEKLRLFQLKMGHCRVVASSFPSDPSLYHWVKNQKSFYRMKITEKKSCMTNERKEKLDQINFLEEAFWGQGEKIVLETNHLERHPLELITGAKNQRDSNNSELPDFTTKAREDKYLVTETLKTKELSYVKTNDLDIIRPETHQSNSIVDIQRDNNSKGPTSTIRKGEDQHTVTESLKNEDMSCAEKSEKRPPNSRTNGLEGAINNSKVTGSTSNTGEDANIASESPEKELLCASTESESLDKNRNKNELDGNIDRNTETDLEGAENSISSGEHEEPFLPSISYNDI